MGFWWAFCVIVVAVYTGNLVAFLSVKKSVLPFNTFTQLSQDSSYMIGVIGGTAPVTLMQVCIECCITGYRQYKKIANRKNITKKYVFLKQPNI